MLAKEESLRYALQSLSTIWSAHPAVFSRIAISRVVLPRKVPSRITSEMLVSAIGKLSVDPASMWKHIYPGLDICDRYLSWTFVAFSSTLVCLLDSFDANPVTFFTICCHTSAQSMFIIKPSEYSGGPERGWVRRARIESELCKAESVRAGSRVFVACSSSKDLRHTVFRLTHSINGSHRRRCRLGSKLQCWLC